MPLDPYLVIEVCCKEMEFAALTESGRIYSYSAQFILVLFLHFGATSATRRNDIRRFAPGGREARPGFLFILETANAGSYALGAFEIASRLLHRKSQIVFHCF